MGHLVSFLILNLVVAVVLNTISHREWQGIWKGSLKLIFTTLGIFSAVAAVVHLLSQ